jgi:hypothetical protein
MFSFQIRDGLGVVRYTELKFHLRTISKVKKTKFSALYNDTTALKCQSNFSRFGQHLPNEEFSVGLLKELTNRQENNRKQCLVYSLQIIEKTSG